MIHRKTYQGEYLTKSDFISGIGFDNHLLYTLLKLKNRQPEEYWSEDGIGIDGSIRKYKFHPLLNKILIDNREGRENRRLTIEYVGKHWYFGSYWTILYSDENGSHGGIDFKNINCIDSSVLQSIKRTKKYFSFEDKKLSWDQF